MEAQELVLLVVAVIGQYLLEFKEFIGNSGVLEETDTELVPVEDAITGMVLVVDSITQNQWVLLLEIVTLFVQVVFTDVVLEIVLGVGDVALM